MCHAFGSSRIHDHSLSSLPAHFSSKRVLSSAAIDSSTHGIKASRECFMLSSTFHAEKSARAIGHDIRLGRTVWRGFAARGLRSSRPRLLALLACGRNSGQAEAQDDEAKRRRAFLATVRRPAAPGAVAPAAAPEHPVRAPLFIKVLAPLPHVAVHVIQAQPIWWIRTYLARALQAAALEIGLLLGQGLRRLLQVEVECALCLVSHRSATAGVFPLFLRRQAILPAGFF